MTGCSRDRISPGIALACLVLASVGAACSHGGYSVEIRPVGTALPDASTIELYVVSSCGATETAGALPEPTYISRVVFAATDPSPPLGTVPSGTVSLYARVINSGCGVVAAGCMAFPVQANGAGTLTLRVSPLDGPSTCTNGQICATGQCRAGVAIDAGMDTRPEPVPEQAVEPAPEPSPLLDVQDTTDVARPDVISLQECGVPFDAMCPMIPPPQLIAPRSTAATNDTTPTFVFQTAAGSDGAEVQICATRDCSAPEAILRGATSVTPTSPLPAGVHFWRAYGTIGALRGAIPTPTWEFHLWNGHGGSGPSWGSVLDVNADGVADIAVSAQNPDRVEVFLGRAGALPASASSILQVAAAAGFGTTLASAGDVNGDGFADLIVGATDGHAYLFLGSAAGIGTSPVTLSAPASASIGTARGAGDVNADGFADIVASPPVTSADAGVYVFNGSSDASEMSTVPVAAAGTYPRDVDGVGDVNNDGFDDIAVAVGGAVDVVAGTASGPLSTVVATLRPSANQPLFGIYVRGVGDVTGDQRPDVAVSSCGFLSSQTPAVWVFPSTPNGIAGTGGTMLPGGTSTGCAHGEPAWDVNADGIGDVLLLTNTAGQASIFGGASGHVNGSADATFTGSTGFGTSGAPAGDIDGNGADDLLIGTPASNQVDIYLGIHGGWPAVSGDTLTPASTASQFGQAVALAGTDERGFRQPLLDAVRDLRPESAFLIFSSSSLNSNGLSSLSSAP